MYYSIYIFLFILSLILLISVGLYFFSLRIKIFEQKLISLFLSRSDSIPALYEVSKNALSRHKEIFEESLNLRKQEFSLRGISKNIEGFMELESHLHHEINFIFQVCNKNPKLLKEKTFLYIRDVFIQKSSDISKSIKIYNKIIKIYNKIIRYKNYTLVWYIIPFSKKSAL